VLKILRGSNNPKTHQLTCIMQVIEMASPTWQNQDDAKSRLVMIKKNS